jgi:hypothetical protein
MGIFGGDEDNKPSQSEMLLNRQLSENRAELERKKQDLYRTRLDIIKGQGGQQWTPEQPHARGRSRGGAGSQSSGGVGALRKFGGMTGYTPI